MPTMTAAQRRERARRGYDAFMADCPTRQVMAVIGSKWSGLLVCALADGPRRHGQLRHRVAGISQKMLTQTLRELEREGLLTRTVTASVPVRVDYALTALGESLVPVLGAVKDWAETHIEQVQRNREEFDEAAA